MSSNLFNLPQIPSGWSFVIALDSDWVDQIYVPSPGWPATPQTATINVIEGTAALTGLASGLNLVPGMVVAGLGLDPTTVIESVQSPTAITLSPAPIATVRSALAFYPPPLDLSGISFRAQIRENLAAPLIVELCTANGMMTNSGATGYFGFAAKSAQLKGGSWPYSLSQNGTLNCIIDIVATDGTNLVNLNQTNSPIPLTVSLGVTQ